MVKRQWVTAVAVLTMMAWGLGAAGNAGADVISTTNLFPPFPGEYASPTGTAATVTFSASGTQMYFRLRQETHPGPPTTSCRGRGDCLYKFLLRYLYGNLHGQRLHLYGGPGHPHAGDIHHRGGDGAGDNPIESVSFNFVAVAPDGSPILFREDPTVTGPIGEVTVTSDPRGYRISSFFDVFLDVSLDGGNTWTPADQPVQLDLTPEPATLSLLALGGCLAVFRRRRRR